MSQSNDPIRRSAGLDQGEHVDVVDIHAAVIREKPEPRRGEGQILRHILQLAEGYGVPLRTAVRIDLAAEDAILRQVRLGGHNLIVMGVARRASEALFFGNVATAILESSERSILFVAS